LYAQLLSMLIQLILERDDLSKVSETLHYFVTHVTFLYKLKNFTSRGKNLLNIEDTLTLPVFYGFSFDQLRQLKREMDDCKTVGKVFRVTCVGAVALYGMVPFLDKNKSMSLPLPGWIPDKVIGKYYHATFLFQMTAVTMTAYVNSTIDILTWMLMTVGSAQFNILKENLKNIDYRSEGNDNQSKIIERNFNQCVKHHKAIVEYGFEYFLILTQAIRCRFVYKIEYTFSNGIFLQFFASVIVICATGFLMIIVRHFFICG
jgi:hypothetical protein